ncbi:hypothetical protein L9F63_017034, partial [Diploptera punctata]
MKLCCGASRNSDDETEDNPQKPKEKKLHNYKRELIEESWGKFMDYEDENSLNVFIILLQRKTNYMVPYGVEGIPYDEIADDILIQLHASKLSSFINLYVESMDDKEREKEIMTKMNDYVRFVRVPATVLKDYKECTITYMYDNGMMPRE